MSSRSTAGQLQRPGSRQDRQTLKEFSQGSDGLTFKALFNPKTSILLQERHPYTGNLNSEMRGDSKNAYRHRGDTPFYNRDLEGQCWTDLCS